MTGLITRATGKRAPYELLASCGAIMAFLAIAPQAQAQSYPYPADQMPAECAVSHSERMIVSLLCDPDANQEILAQAGKVACADRLPCGAWVWTDLADVPQAAPRRHDDLTQEQVTSAAGVWVAEKEIFIAIGVVEN